MKIKISSLFVFILIAISLSFIFASNIGILQDITVIINKPNVILYEINGNELREVISLSEPIIGAVSDSKNDKVEIEFNYVNLNYEDASKLKIMKCSDWDNIGKSCQSSWSAVDFSIDKNMREITGYSKGSGAYFLVEDKCGNGLCEADYGETSLTCSEDCGGKKVKSKPLFSNKGLDIFEKDFQVPIAKPSSKEENGCQKVEKIKKTGDLIPETKFPFDEKKKKQPMIHPTLEETNVMRVENEMKEKIKNNNAVQEYSDAISKNFFKISKELKNSLDLDKSLMVKIKLYRSYSDDELVKINRYVKFINKEDWKDNQIVALVGPKFRNDSPHFIEEVVSFDFVKSVELLNIKGRGEINLFVDQTEFFSNGSLFIQSHAIAPWQRDEQKIDRLFLRKKLTISEMICKKGEENGIF